MNRTRERARVEAGQTLTCINYISEITPPSNLKPSANPFYPSVERQAHGLPSRPSHSATVTHSPMCRPLPLVCRSVRECEERTRVSRHTWTFSRKKFDAWRIRVGGLNLDAFANAHDAQLPSYCSVAHSFFQQDVRARRVWLYAPHHLVGNALRRILSAQEVSASTACLALVPCRPNVWWWSLRAQFVPVHRYGRGEEILQRVHTNGARGPLSPVMEPYELWWLPPGKPPAHRAMHSEAMRKKSRAILTCHLKAGHRTDGALAHHVPHLGRLSEVGPPSAAVARELMSNDPSCYKSLDSSTPPIVTNLKPAKWAAAHCEHCPLCSLHGCVQSSCYGSRVVQRLRHGYEFPLLSKPPIRKYDNYKSVMEEKLAVCRALDKMDDMDVFSEPVSEIAPNTSTFPLQAAVRRRDRLRMALTGQPYKARVCSDLSRNFNEFSPSWKFVYSGIDQVCEMLTPGCWMAVLDLESFFPQLPIHPNSYKYMWFKDPRDNQYRHFKRVPFGARLAPAWASVVSSELCHVLRKRGVSRCNAFVDDIIVIGDTQEECALHLRIALETCAELGLPVNPKKVDQPSQTQTYLGIIIDSVQREIRATPEKFDFAVREIEGLMALKSLSRS